MLPPGSRRSKIRPPRKSLASTPDSSDPHEYEKSWLVLSNAIMQIQLKNVSNLSYEQLYRKAYALVLRKLGGKLYDNVTQLIVQHLKIRRQHVFDMISNASINSSMNQDVLKAVVAEWDDHLQSMKFISDVLMYLNRVYVKEQKKLLIYDLGIQLFEENFIQYNDNEIGSKLVDIIIEEITKSRKGEVITSKMYITKTIGMFELLVESEASDQFKENYYQRHFELKFLTSSETYFHQLSEQFINEPGDIYLHEVSAFIKEEENRTKFYLPQSTYPKLVTLMNNILIKDKLDRILSLPYEQHGLSYFLDPIISNIMVHTADHHIAELKIIYDFVSKIDPELNLLKLRLKEQVIEQGSKIPSLVKASLEQTASSAPNKKVSANSTSFALKWVEVILEMEAQYIYLIRECFSNGVMVEQSVISGMREFINVSKGKKSNIEASNGPETLSVYMDHHIKQLTKATSKRGSGGDSGVDDFIKKSIAFLRFIKDKDAFEAHYANHFAKRFLNSKNSSLQSGAGPDLGSDLEGLIISKLGEELGSTSLDKVIRMNKDIKRSVDLTADWKKYYDQHLEKDSLVELELKICNVSDWPKSMTKDYKNFSSESGFIWSSQIRPTIREFEEYWLTGKRNDNKSLFWCPKFGSMDLRITYPSRMYEINLSTYAGIIMLLFAPQSTDANGDPVLAFEEKRLLTYDEIKELTGIPEVDLKRQLQSIAVAPRLRLLIKSPMTKEIFDNDVFKLNDKFKSPSTKVKVLTVSASSKTTSTTTKTAEEEESEELQANILEGRKIVVGAAIVRIMKSRQQITHNELVPELIKQLHNRFQPLTILIKQRIEDLIEKEYLKRDEENRALYRYIA